MSDAFALILRPHEAASIHTGWPDGCWLVLRSEPAPGSWQCGAEDTLPVLLHGFPAWPPLPGMDAPEVDPADESALLAAFSRLSGVGETAAAAMMAGAPDAGSGWDNPAPAEWE